jgi:hypothetical protein
MNRLTLVAPILLAACAQDIDLGNSRMNAQALEPSAPPSPRSAAAGCPFEDPALLKAPDACPASADPAPSDGFAVCVVTADGPVPRPAGTGLTVPGCPAGVYFTFPDPLPPPANIERAVLAFKGDDNDKSAFAADTGTPLPRTIEMFPDRRSFFVRLDPRPGAGLLVRVLARCAELYQAEPVNPCGYGYGYGAWFHAGDRPVR